MKHSADSPKELNNFRQNIPEPLTDLQRLGHIRQNSYSLKVKSKFGFETGEIQMFAINHSSQFNSTNETQAELTGDNVNLSETCCVVL